MVEQSFFCHTCLEYQPMAEQSPDIRYCKGGCDFLLKETAMIREHGVTKRANWMPVKTPQKEKKVVVGDSVIVSTLKKEKSLVDTIDRKFKQLPEDLIGRLANEGLGCKAIAAGLKAQCGVEVSYRTIHRILLGERKRDIEIDTLPVLDSKHHR